AYSSLADFYKSQGEMDTSIFYAKKALTDFRSLGLFDRVNQEYTFLYYLYKSNRKADSAYVYVQLSKTLGDSLNKAEKHKIYAYQNAGFNEQIKAQEQENERIQRENAIRTYTLLAGIVVCMLIAFLLYRNNRTRRKANELLQKQKEEIEVQKKNVEETLVELKSTQSQLIQSEKMATLGELTAGIAHEIQNPLNFVNNFSEVNTELIEELKTELATGNKQLAIEIADSIKDNEEKINHHGKRADAIVKGMLQHSRSSSGQKEPTDINALADEYLRLAYHGLRAKDKSFNATMETDFDNTIGNINIVPQDIGRVILNLITNAFYAVTEKKKQIELKGLAPYDPTVSITTRSIGSPSGDGGKVELMVKDNGNGIPQKMLDKIFQPFFTTKPTGQGTGLGLSLSYDIIKAHGGEIKVVSKEGEGTEFIIQLPLV
ncbi:MAG TPA: ATP-binding protein, partial [Chitinophagaceae bacterium]|nr:ATP-binding protein [Chitinophagaceae bacterium]